MTPFDLNQQYAEPVESGVWWARIVLAVSNWNKNQTKGGNSGLPAAI